MAPTTKRVEKTVHEEDPLGNKLYKPNGKPKMVTICVNEPMHNANVSYTQTPQTPFNPINQQQGFNPGRGRGANTGGNKEGNRAGKGRGGSNRGSNNGNNGGQSRQPGQNNHKNNTTGAKNTTGGTTGNTTSNRKCTICNGAHTNLMYCSKLTQYLPYGYNQLHPQCPFVLHA